MTRIERLKLAKAARELASEFAEERGPALDKYDYCGCIMGQVFRRAGIANPYPGNPAADLERELDDKHRACGDYPDPTQATFHEVGTVWTARIPGAVVFPLLWLADELESQP